MNVVSSKTPNSPPKICWVKTRNQLPPFAENIRNELAKLKQRAELNNATLHFYQVTFGENLC